MGVIRLRWRPIYVFMLKSFDECRLMATDEFPDGQPNRFSFILKPAALNKPAKFLGQFVGQLDMQGFHRCSLLHRALISIVNGGRSCVLWSATLCRTKTRSSGKPR